MRIDKKILLTFLTTILVGMIIIVSFSSFATINLSGSASSDAGKITLEEELLNLDRLARDQALLVNAYFEQILSDMNLFANFAEDLVNSRIPILPRESYVGIKSQDSNFSNPPGLQHSPLYGFEVSYAASAYYIPGIDSVDQISNDMAELVNTSSNLDYLFQTLFSSNPTYIFSYMGFNNGFHRIYPYHDLSSWTNIEFESAAAGQIIQGFDPRHREFYVDAQLSGGRAINDTSLNPIAIGQPHLDPTGSGLVITVSHPIYLDNGTLIGVVGSDLSLREMESEIKNVELLETGYSFMIDKNFTPIIHKKLTASLASESIVDLEYSNNNDVGLTNFQSILDKMILLETDQEEYIKNGEKWYISYYPVEIPQFSLAIIVSESQILVAAKQIEDKANDAMVQQLFTFFFIIIFFGFFMFYGLKRISEKIVDPIRELTLVTDQIAKGDLNKSLSGEVGGSKEIALLYNTFRGLVTALRFGNEEYYSGNLKRAMDNYQNALELFSTMDNTKGIGICYNNIANIQKARGRLKEANASYLKAIEIGESLLEDSTTRQERTELIMSLSSRNNNVAMLYMEIEKYDIAEELLQKSLEYDLSIENKKGYATRYGNLGLIYLAQDKIDMSKETFYKAYELATDLDSKRTIAYAEMNLGIYHRKINENERAKEYLFSATEHAEELDTRVVITSLVNLKEIFIEEGATRLASEIDHRLEVQKIGVKKPKNIIFVLDHSGSMMIGGRNRQSISGISSIFENQVDEDDIVSFLIFNYKGQTLINNAAKSSLTDFQTWLKTLSQPTGGTAMYDAIGDAFNIARDVGLTSDVWILVLTDGDDNSSRRYNHNKILKLVDEIRDVNLVIIGVGGLDKDRDNLKKITKRAANGLFIGIESGVDGAITEAFEEVGTMLAEVEVEGFVPDY